MPVADIRSFFRAVEYRCERLFTVLYCLRHGITAGTGARIARGAVVSRKQGGTIRLGRRCGVHRGAMVLSYGGDIEIGDDVTINPYSVLYGLGGLKIGNGVRIAAHVVIVPANHQIAPDRFIFQQAESRIGITIEDDVWIGAGARILDGVILRRGTVVGAGAVVTRSTDPFGMYTGVPARKVGDRLTRPAARKPANGLGAPVGHQSAAPRHSS